MTVAAQDIAGLPDMKVSVRQLFGIDTEMEVPAYSEADEHVPDIDADYRFDRGTTLAILAGFAHNRRVIVSGYHGTGKSTHIEQVAARPGAWRIAPAFNSARFAAHSKPQAVEPIGVSVRSGITEDE